MRHTKYFIDTEFIEDGTMIDLISIGFVAEDGREYYAQSVECDFKKANAWVCEHVFPQLKQCYTLFPFPFGFHTSGTCSEPGCTWRTRSQIAADVLAFMNIEKYGPPELWGYFSAYDHVAFAQLFGAMIDLPLGFPMYTHDLKQWCDDLGNPRLPEYGEDEHNALADARWNKRTWEYLDALSGKTWTRDQLDELARYYNAIMEKHGGQLAIITTVEAMATLREVGLVK